MVIFSVVNIFFCSLLSLDACVYVLCRRIRYKRDECKWSVCTRARDLSVRRRASFEYMCFHVVRDTNLQCDLNGITLCKADTTHTPHKPHDEARPHHSNSFFFHCCCYISLSISLMRLLLLLPLHTKKSRISMQIYVECYQIKMKNFCAEFAFNDSGNGDG